MYILLTLYSISFKSLYTGILTQANKDPSIAATSDATLPSKEEEANVVGGAPKRPYYYRFLMFKMELQFYLMNLGIRPHFLYVYREDSEIPFSVDMIGKLSKLHVLSPLMNCFHEQLSPLHGKIDKHRTTEIVVKDLWKFLQVKFINIGTIETLGVAKDNEYDLFTGKGLYRWPSGSYYIGNFYKSKMEGYGFYYFYYGDFYFGYFKNNFMQGKGAMFSCNKGKITYYYGNFEKDIKSGIGVTVTIEPFDGSDVVSMQLNHATSSTNVTANRLVGGQLSTQQLMASASAASVAALSSSSTKSLLLSSAIAKSSCFYGTHANDRMSGQGVLKYSNNDIYVGMFKDDLRHGFGTLCYR